MWPFGPSKKKLKEQQRKSTIAALDAAVAAQDTPKVSGTVEQLYKGGFAKGREGTDIVLKAIFAVDQYSIDDALRLAMWCINNKSTEQDQRRYISLMTLPLTDMPGRDDAQTLALVCAASLAAANSRSGYDVESAAHTRWRAAIKKLRTVDVQLAFAAASSAALSKDSRTMIDSGVNEWEEIVGEINKTDPAVAKAEAQRVTENYIDTNISGQAFRARARRVLMWLG